MRSRRPIRIPAKRRGQTPAERHWTRWAFLLLCLFVALVMAVPTAWARPRGSPNRQTVPRTPPPTWTPSHPSDPTKRPTRPQPPTSETGTPSPAGEPTKAPVARPWLGLSADPLMAQPGTSIAILLEVRNIGNGSMENATITLAQDPGLSYQQVKTSLGRAELGPDGLTWTLDAVGGQDGGVLELAAVVDPDVLPGGRILLRGILTWPGGQVESNEWPITLPAALLPEAGG